MKFKEYPINFICMNFPMKRNPMNNGQTKKIRYDYARKN